MISVRFFSPRLIALVLVFFGAPAIFSQAQTIQKDSLNWGAEYDFMAPRIGQWHSVNIDGYVAHGRFKHSLMFAHINIRDQHLTAESFSKDNLNAFGYRFEIFSHKKLRRWSTGLMLLYSMHNVVSSVNGQPGKFDTFFLGVPIGYTWVLWDHLTINPGISILYPLTNRKVTIGGDVVEQAPWGLEPGIKIGWRF